MERCKEPTESGPCVRPKGHEHGSHIGPRMPQPQQPDPVQEEYTVDTPTQADAPYPAQEGDAVEERVQQWKLWPVLSEQIRKAGDDDWNHADWVIRVDGPLPPAPREVVPLSLLTQALEAMERGRGESGAPLWVVARAIRADLKPTPDHG